MFPDFLAQGQPVHVRHIDVEQNRERIYEAVWGLDGEGNSDTVMEHIRKIRAKLAACTLHSYIDTVFLCCDAVGASKLTIEPSDKISTPPAGKVLLTKLHIRKICPNIRQISRPLTGWKAIPCALNSM